MTELILENYVTGARRIAAFASVPRAGERVKVKDKWFTVQEVAHEPDADGDYQTVVRVAE